MDAGAKPTLRKRIEQAFDYRGNVTVELADGTRVVGYLFNRDFEGPEPFVELLGPRGEGPIRMPMAAIVDVHLTGRDMAAPKSVRGRARVSTTSGTQAEVASDAGAADA